MVHAAEQAAKSSYADQVAIAGDHDDIKSAVEPYGYEYISTGEHHTSGARAAAEDGHGGFEWPDGLWSTFKAMSPKLIPITDAVIEAMTDPNAKCSTLACLWIPTTNATRMSSRLPSLAMATQRYFSRSLIPLTETTQGRTLASRWALCLPARHAA